MKDRGAARVATPVAVDSPPQRRTGRQSFSRGEEVDSALAMKRKKATKKSTARKPARKTAKRTTKKKTSKR
jgi:hypothetical protein